MFSQITLITEVCGVVMNILIMSDSHRYIKAMIKATELEMPDLIVHLGDHDDDCNLIAEKFPDIPLRVVRGNGDFYSEKPATDQFTVEGKSFFITHGHLFGVKYGYENVISAAKEKSADIVLFGHTHHPYSKINDGLYVVNPGSIGILNSTYALMHLKDGVVSCDIRHIYRN
jgi:putative phosphoesterase